MLRGKVIITLFYSIIISVIFELFVRKIETNKLDKIPYNYSSIKEKNSKEVSMEYWNPSLELPDKIHIRIGILANPEPINEIYNPDETSIKIDKTRKGIFNSTYVNWLNKTVNSDFIIQEIQDYFNFSSNNNGLKINLEFIPLLFWQNDSIIDDILSKINGVLFIGGDRLVDLKYEWEKYAIKVMKKILQLQETNRKIPLWGICQGIEIINTILVNTTDVLEKFSSWNQMQKIKIKEFEEIENKKRSIYFYLNDNEKEFMTNEKSTVHYHNLGLNPDSFKNKDYSILKQMFQISSYGYDSNDKKFINSVESYEPYNIFAVQYHPEKKPIKKIKNLRKSNENFMEKFNMINSKITINYFIKAIEDFLIIKNNNNNLESTKKNSNGQVYIEKYKISDINIFHNFQGSFIPVYLFSE